jgi:hypothetical protein
MQLASEDPAVSKCRGGGSSSSSPSPLGASRRFSCDICGGSELGKYTCPACGVHTCSLHCQRQHKSTTGCSGVRSRCEFVRAEDMGLTTMCRCVTGSAVCFAPFAYPVDSARFACSQPLCFDSPCLCHCTQRRAILARCSCRPRQGRSCSSRRTGQNFTATTSSCWQQIQPATFTPGSAAAARSGRAAASPEGSAAGSRRTRSVFAAAASGHEPSTRQQEPFQPQGFAYCMECAREVRPRGSRGFHVSRQRNNVAHSHKYTAP